MANTLAATWWGAVSISEQTNEGCHSYSVKCENGFHIMGQPRQPDRRENTRRYPRYELETELKAAILGLEQRETRGRSLNINEGGMGGIFVSGWEVGTPLALLFSVPITSTPIKIKGVVRNRTGYRYGFEFTELTPEERETIARTCRTLNLLQ